MHITRVRAYRVALPLHEGSYKWSGDKSVTVFDSTVVEVETDAGVTGWGEVCPLGPFYLPAYGPGARTGIAELAPHLIGMDPRELGPLNHRMDAALKGHPYVKSAIDMACWDILGKAAGLPVCVLLGGRFGEAVDLYRAISQESSAKMAASVTAWRSMSSSRCWSRAKRSRSTLIVMNRSGRLGGADTARRGDAGRQPVCVRRGASPSFAGRGGGTTVRRSPSGRRSM